MINSDEGNLLLPPTSIVNHSSTTGSAALDTPAPTTGHGPKTILSGALTADTYATGLSITGRGILEYLAVTRVDATSRVLGCRVTIDGTVVFTALDSARGAADEGIIVVGTADASMVSYAQVPFNSSLLVEIQSSITETDKVQIRTAYRLT